MRKQSSSSATPAPQGGRKKGQQLIRGLCSGAPGAEISFDPEEKSKLLTQFYGDLFKATECQAELSKWVRLEDHFEKGDLEGMPRIYGALLRGAINLFKKGKSCAGDDVVAEMLTVLDEDVLDMMAEAFEKRILNQEAQDDGLLIKKFRSSMFVEYPTDESVDRRDGWSAKRRNIVHVEDKLVMSFEEEGSRAAADHQTRYRVPVPPPTAPLTPQDRGERWRIMP